MHSHVIRLNGCITFVYISSAVRTCIPLCHNIIYICICICIYHYLLISGWPSRQRFFANLCENIPSIVSAPASPPLFPPPSPPFPLPPPPSPLLLLLFFFLPLLLFLLLLQLLLLLLLFYLFFLFLLLFLFLLFSSFSSSSSSSSSVGEYFIKKLQRVNIHNMQICHKYYLLWENQVSLSQYPSYAILSLLAGSIYVDFYDTPKR